MHRAMGGALFLLVCFSATAETAPETTASETTAPATTAPETTGVEEAASGSIVVVITGLTEPDAAVEVNVWRGKDGWLDRSSNRSRYRTSTVRGEAGRARAVFHDLSHRDYAVTAYQDDNENSRLDQGMFRIPRERLGFSNGLRPRFSAPKYENAAVQLNSDELLVEIELHKMP